MKDRFADKWFVMKQWLGIIPAESYYTDERLRRRFWLRLLRIWEYIAYEDDESKSENEVNGMSKKKQGKKPQPEAKKPPAKPETDKSQPKEPVKPAPAKKPPAAKPQATKPTAAKTTVKSATTPPKRNSQTKAPQAAKPLDAPVPVAASQHSSTPWIVIAGFSLVLVVIAAFIILTGPARDQKDAKATNATPTMVAASSHTPTTAETQPGQDPRFIQKDVGLGDLNRVIGTGLPGNTAKEFTASVLKVSGHSAKALAIYANAVHLWPNPNDTDGLLTPDGTYLSTKGIMLWASVQGALKAKGTTSKVGNAPANWYNTGVSNGRFGRSAYAGISGNRTALIVTFKDGSKFVALRRCGNLALPGKGGLPVVPTDNLAPKIASQDAYAQGKAPVGGGQNDTSGPGDYTKTPDKPGKTPRPNPTPPPPSPQPTPGATQTPTPDPQPTPTPTTSTTPTGTVTPPGM